MLLSFPSINKLVDILTGQLYDYVPETKKFIDEILRNIGKDNLVETYDICFDGKIDIVSNRQYSSKVYKLQQYTRLKIEELNGTVFLEDMIISAISAIKEIIYYNEKKLYNIIYGTQLDEIEAQNLSNEKILELIKSLNDNFEVDNVSIEYIEQNNAYKIYALDDCFVVYNCLFNERQIGNFILINEHNRKCHEKILAGDFSGAITNSRSLLEQILREIELSIYQKENPGSRLPGYDGKIENLMNRVFTKLNITEHLTDKPKRGYEKIESGFKDINSGISVLRHGMSDAHNISFSPSKKDALLAVNSAKTLANFLVEVYFEKFGDAA